MARNAVDIVAPPDRIGRGHAVAAAIVAVALVAGLFAMSFGSPAQAPAQRSAEAVKAPGFDAEDAALLSDALNSRDAGRLAQVLEDPSVVQDPAAAASIVRDGETLTILAKTFDVDAEVGDAEVEARIDGPEPATLTFFLVDVDGQWKIAGSTAPAPEFGS